MHVVKLHTTYQAHMAVTTNAIPFCGSFFIEELYCLGSNVRALSFLGNSHIASLKKLERVWLAAMLIDWAGPTPYDDVSLGLASQIAGLRGNAAGLLCC